VSRIIAIDSGPLSLLVHRKGSREADACKQWFDSQEALGARFVVPEIADYEVRRELLRSGKVASIARLDRAAKTPTVQYVPLRTSAIRLAAQLWADVRNRGLPTSDRFALDADVILVAQLLDAGFAPPDLIVATSNVGHLSRFVPAMSWQDIA
jgi:hypothetical protein